MMSSSRLTLIKSHDGESDEEEMDAEQKKKRAAENDRYYMGYFKWHWGKNGFWRSLWAFCGEQFRSGTWWAFFNNIGLAFGAFFARQFFLRDEWMSVWAIKYK